MGKQYRIQVGEKTHEVTFLKKEGSTVSFSIEGELYDITLSAPLTGIAGSSSSPTPHTPSSKRTQTSQDINTVHAPMPGLVVSIKAKPGQSVKEGEPLLVLEAMKMENAVSAHKAGVISAILVKEGEQVESGTALIRFE